MIYICKWYPAKEKLNREKQSLFRMSDFSLPCHFPLHLCCSNFHTLQVLNHVLIKETPSK